MPKPLWTIILCILYSGCIIPTYTGKSSLRETKVNKLDAKFTSLLIVGVGSTASRLFLENLSPEIIKLFGRSHIKCDFLYAGKIPRSTHINLQKIIVSPYDAYLVINPIDTSYIDVHKRVATYSSPLPGGHFATGSVIGNQFKEDYYVELYTSNNILNKVWQAELKVDFDVANPARYGIIAKGIFNRIMNNSAVINK